MYPFNTLKLCYRHIEEEVGCVFSYFFCNRSLSLVLFDSFFYFAQLMLGAILRRKSMYTKSLACSPILASSAYNLEKRILQK